MKGSLIAALAAGVIVGGGGGALAVGLSGCTSGSPSASANHSGSPKPSPSASQTGSQDGSEKPPQCVTVEISENSGNGPVLWTKWCGTGTNGAAPMKAKTGQLIVDGSSLDPSSCTQASPCIISWPSSPQQ